MSEAVETPEPLGRAERGGNQWLLLIAGGIVSIVVAVLISFGGRVVNGGETTAILTAQVNLLLEGDKEQRRMLQDLTVKMGDLYTRREAQADREAAERRFQSIENTQRDFGHRLEALETGLRYFQQTLIDKSNSARR